MAPFTLLLRSATDVRSPEKNILFCSSSLFGKTRKRNPNSFFLGNGASVAAMFGPQQFGHIFPDQEGKKRSSSSSFPPAAATAFHLRERRRRRKTFSFFGSNFPSSHPRNDDARHSLSPVSFLSLFAGKYGAESSRTLFQIGGK